MKAKYLEELRFLLNRYSMSEIEIDDIVNDYNEMYDNWLNSGMVEEEVEDKLGAPSEIYRELVEGYQTVEKTQRVKRSRKNDKYIAITPFISLVAFFIIGFAFEGWAYGWLVFLLIPMTAIVLEVSKGDHKFTALMPFIAGIIYFYFGFVHNIWHPTWLVFMIIPITAILTDRKSIGTFESVIALSPLVILVVFLYLGFENSLWVPAWTLFLIITLLGSFKEKNKLKMLVWNITILGGVAGYLYIGYTYGEWGYALLSYIPLVIFGIIQGEITVQFQTGKDYIFVSVVAATAFFVLGYLTGDWGYWWVVFLAVPVFAILKETKGNERSIAIMPFISLVIFFTLGWFFGLWAYAWLAFLLIPVVAIIKES